MGYYQPVVNPFIGNMLELRNQRLREQLAKDEAMAQLGKGIGSMIGQLGQGLGGMAQQGKQDAIANQLMSETMGTPPRAQAVDPSMQGPADAAAGRMPGFYSGGTDELAMRMKMIDMKNEQMRAQAYQQQVEETKARHIIGDAENARKQVDEKTQQDLKNETWYIKENRAIDESIAKAEDPIAYQAAVDAKMALHKTQVKHGKDVQPLDPASIPPFMTKQEKQQLADQRQAVADAQAAMSAAQAEPAGMWDQIRSSIGLKPESNVLGIPVTFDSERAINAAQAKFKQEQETLSGLKGADYKAPEAQPAVAPAATGATSTGSSKYPVGYRMVHPQTGRARTWDGEKWVYGQ